jgi:hypothetical protein
MIFEIENNTVILSFLKCERTVNVILQSFLTVYLLQYDRFMPFTVPDRSLFLTVSKRFKNGQERPGTFES